MSYKAEIYPYGHNYQGFFIQCENKIKTIEKISKRELIKMADLRHPVLSEKEFFETISHDENGNERKEFTLLGDTFSIKVTK